MDCLSSEDLKGRKRNSLCLTAYTESECCQVGNVPSVDARSVSRRSLQETEEITVGRGTDYECVR